MREKERGRSVITEAEPSDAGSVTIRSVKVAAPRTVKVSSVPAVEGLGLRVEGFGFEV